MTRARFAFLALVVAVILAGASLAGCDADRRAISRDDLPDVPAEPTVTVELGDDGFGMASIAVTTADLVRFRNVGQRDHGVRTVDFAIDTGPLFPDEWTLVVFDEPGDYTVVDTEDDEVTMTVTVTESDEPASGVPR